MIRQENQNHTKKCDQESLPNLGQDAHGVLGGRFSAGIYGGNGVRHAGGGEDRVTKKEYDAEDIEGPKQGPIVGEEM